MIGSYSMFFSGAPRGSKHVRRQAGLTPENEGQLAPYVSQSERTKYGKPNGRTRRAKERRAMPQAQRVAQRKAMKVARKALMEDAAINRAMKRQKKANTNDKKK